MKRPSRSQGALECNKPSGFASSRLGCGRSLRIFDNLAPFPLPAIIGPCACLDRGHEHMRGENQVRHSIHAGDEEHAVPGLDVREFVDEDIWTAHWTAARRFASAAMIPRCSSGNTHSSAARRMTSTLKASAATLGAGVTAISRSASISTPISSVYC